MLTYSMTLSPQQDSEKMPRLDNGAIIPITIGDTALCENMREPYAGQLEAVGEPISIASLSNTPVAVDKRGDKQYLFTCGTDRRLMLDGILDDNNHYEAVNTFLATLPEKVNQYASVGEFLILLLSDGTLWYLLWNSDLETYTPLGRLPQMPAIDAMPTDIVGYQTTIAGIDFGETITDMRVDIPDKIEQDIGRAVKSAWQEIELASGAGGRWSQPVSVRFAVRLWDGRLLHVSEPQIVAPEGGFNRPQRILLPLIGGNDGFTGTQPVVLNIESFKIAVSIKNDWDIGNWKDVVRGVEVWLSPSLDIIDDKLPVDVSAYSSSSVNYLSAVVPMKTLNRLTEELISTRYYRHSLLSGEMLSEFTLSQDLSVADNLFSSSTFVNDTFLDIKAKAILGHGDFLYLGNVCRSYPKPIVHSAGNDGVAIRCIVSVDICTPLGLRRVSAEQTLTSTRLTPLLSYPDRDAVRMEIKMLCDDGVHYGSFLLRAQSQENASVYIEESLLPITLPTDSTEEFIDEDVGGEQDSQYSTLITTERGNPFVEKSITRNCGGEIVALAAQSAGGGAYTRQFIYLFTNKGIVALMHKPDGEHTNCRFIASDIVDSSKKITTTSDGVYALSLSGDLVRLNDSRRHTLFGGLKGAAALAWNRSKQELWVIPNPSATDSWQRSIVIQITKNFRAWLSSTIPYHLISNSGEPLYVDLGNIVLPTMSTYTGMLKLLSTEQSPTDNQQWISSPIDNSKRGLIIGRIGVYGKRVEADVEVESISEGAGLDIRGDSYESGICDRVHLSGNFSSPVETHFMVGTEDSDSLLFPARRRLPLPKLRFRIYGYIPALNAISLL